MSTTSSSEIKEGPFQPERPEGGILMAILTYCEGIYENVQELNKKITTIDKKLSKIRRSRGTLFWRCSPFGFGFGFGFRKCKYLHSKRLERRRLKRIHNESFTYPQSYSPTVPVCKTEDNNIADNVLPTYSYSEVPQGNTCDYPNHPHKPVQRVIASIHPFPRELDRPHDNMEPVQRESTQLHSSSSSYSLPSLLDIPHDNMQPPPPPSPSYTIRELDSPHEDHMEVVQRESTQFHASPTSIVWSDTSDDDDRELVQSQSSLLSPFTSYTLHPLDIPDNNMQPPQIETLPSPPSPSYTVGELDSLHEDYTEVVQRESTQFHASPTSTVWSDTSDDDNRELVQSQSSLLSPFTSYTVHPLDIPDNNMAGPSEMGYNSSCQVPSMGTSSSSGISTIVAANELDQEMPSLAPNSDMGNMALLTQHETLQASVGFERQEYNEDPSNWSVDDVILFVTRVDPHMARTLSHTIRHYEIDGKALLQLNSDKMMKCMGLNLGIALKFSHYIQHLKEDKYFFIWKTYAEI